MDPLSTLRRKLSKTNDLAFEGLSFDHSPMAAEIASLERWVKVSGSPNPESDVVLETLHRFNRQPTVTNFRDTQLLCFGSTVPFVKNKKRIIEDDDLFEKLLRCAERFRSKPRAFRRCYKGLL